MARQDQVNHSRHAVTLFDSDASRAAAIATFVLEALVADEPVAVLATGAHWEAVVRAAGEGAALISQRLTDGRLAFLDAEVLLYDISRGGVPDRELFRRAIGQLQRSLPAGRVRVYGELVDLLAARGDLDAALRLEQLWNELLDREPITLLCGYDATVFAPDRAAARLRSVCECHSETRMSSDDTLGRWLLTQAAVDVVNS
ncbi:MAG TPA: MEDS domain-containing protein [Vicinamibacterales bacterium]|jgi:hypothetical protein|nr:MEDS domain-containing protein [Vicinamibacterales bacterium]